MRILAVTNMYPTRRAAWGGTFVEQQIESLKKAGVEVDLLFLDRLQEGRRVYVGMAGRLRRRVRETRPDLMHVMYGGLIAEVGTRAVKRVPVVVSFCGSDLLGDPQAGALRRFTSGLGVRASWAAAPRAAGVIVKSENLRQALPPGVDMERVTVIPNGIDLSRFQPLDRAACAARLGWPEDRFHVLFPSFPEHPRKGYDLAQRAVERLRADGVPVILHCLDKVAHADVPMWLSAADCVILTSTHEGSPNIVKEALGCGQAVVSVDVGDVRERLAGVPGCEVVTPDSESLAAALGRTRLVARIEADRPLRRRRVEELSLQSAAAKVVAVYESVLRRSSTSAPPAARRREEGAA